MRFYFSSITVLYKILNLKEIKSEEECKQLISKYEPSDSKNENELTIAGFSIYLNDIHQHLMDPELYENTYQEMDQPLQNYFINSSHNT